MILPDLAGQAVRTERGRLHYHQDWGMTIKDTSLHQQIKAVLREEAVAEAKRLLYVAVTRAEEQLVLCGIGTEEDYNLGKPLEQLGSWWEWLLLGLEQIEPHLFQLVPDLDAPLELAEETAAAAEAPIAKTVSSAAVPEHYTAASFSATSLMIFRSVLAATTTAICCGCRNWGLLDRVPLFPAV